MNNSQSELPQRKRFRDENPTSLSSPEQNTNKKKKKKNKNKGQGALIPQEQNEPPHARPNPNPETPEVATETPISAEKERGAEPNAVTAEHHPVSDSTPRKRKRKNKNKNVAVVINEGEQPNALRVESVLRNAKEKGAESGEVSALQPQVRHKHELATLVVTANPVVLEKENWVELKETNAEQPQLCNKQELVPLVVVDPGKEDKVGKNEGAAEHGELDPVPDSTPSKDTPRKKKKKSEKKKKNVLSVEGVDLKGSNSKQLQVRDHVDPAVPIGVEPKIVKEIGAGPDDANAEQHPVRPKQEPAIPVVPEKKEGAQSSECSPKPPPEDTPRKRKRERKMQNVINPQGAEPNESNNAEHPQVCSEPKSASPIHPQQVIPMGPEIATDPEQKLSNKKRRKKKKSALQNEVAEPDKHNGEPPEIPAQRSMCPVAASHTDETIPTEQKLSIDSATPRVPKQKMSKRQRRKQYQIALKSRGSESDKHHTESSAEILVQRPHGLEATSVPFKSNGETSVGKGNVEQPANIQVRRSKRLAAIALKRHRESSMRCLSCQQPGHKFKNCPRLKRLSYNEEICFFCGEIGHSLAKCSVSRAGARFATCLFCYAHGHFTNKCPRNGHGIDPKVVAVNEPVDKAVEA